MKTKEKPAVQTWFARHKAVWISAIVICVITVVSVIAAPRIIAASQPQQPEVITVPTLQRIINLSDLSTSTSVYNGIAEVTDEDDPEKIDYYVSYKAKVKAGIDLNEVTIEIDDEAKIVSITLPQVHLTEVNVDITSLDYIFLDDGANTSTVSSQAYKACEADANVESQQQGQILELARQNAENTINALVEPFVQQADAAYIVKIA